MIQQKAKNDKRRVLGPCVTYLQYTGLYSSFWRQL